MIARTKFGEGEEVQAQSLVVLCRCLLCICSLFGNRKKQLGLQ